MKKRYWLLLLFVLVAVALLWLRSATSGRIAILDPWEPPSALPEAGPAAPRVACARSVPENRAFFGDLHVHTALSYDAYGYGTPAMPTDAYRFATGEPIALATSTDGVPDRLQIDRPLDFAAVADHAEWLADASLCTTPGSPPYNGWYCKGFRKEGRLNSLRYIIRARLGERRSANLCGDDNSLCRAATLTAWERSQQATEAFYDRSWGCAFTTFHAYEYSRRDGAYMMHRNVIFRNERIPELPVSWLDVDRLEDLWSTLDAQCNGAPGDCEALAIPHNMNLSSGMAFQLPYTMAGEATRREYAQLRARFEPLVEMMQAKGESECRGGLPGVLGAPDEYCDFEKMVPTGDKAPAACDNVPGEVPLRRCVGPLSFARYGLAEGLAERVAVGINPLQYGFIGSTDTHNGTPGAVQESAYVGHTGARDGGPAVRLKNGGRGIRRNPGGLAGIYAPHNTRDALFDAMQRRETFATSGPRIEPRFFAGYDLPADLCQRPDAMTRAYAGGVPMGGELAPRATSPAFLVQARRDAGSDALPGNDLERLQVVKVWSEGQGQFGQAVFDVAQADYTGAALDADTCRPLAAGAANLCTTWTDPDYDPEQPAAYYLRVLEMPSCRWSRLQCLSLPESERPVDCDNPEMEPVIQERAWTSPIWLVGQVGS